MKTRAAMLYILMISIMPMPAMGSGDFSAEARAAMEQAAAEAVEQMQHESDGNGERDITAELAAYIPKNLQDSFVQLNKILSTEEIEEMKTGTEEDMVVSHHFGFGATIRNHWGLWQGSRLRDWFKDLGINHPDDMSGIILDSYWRHLNGKPINLDEQVQYYKDYWEKAIPQYQELMQLPWMKKKKQQSQERKQHWEECKKTCANGVKSISFEEPECVCKSNP